MRLTAKTFLTLAGGLLLIAVPGRADTFQFNDLTDAVSITSTNNSRITDSGCLIGPLEESCSPNIGAPSSGATITGATFPVGSLIIVGEPFTGTVSDELRIINNFVGSTSYIVDFISYVDPFTIGTCAAEVGGCQITENGTLQPALGMITWSDGTIDTFEFQSNVPAPEPSTLLLLFTGFLATAGAALRKRLA